MFYAGSDNNLEIESNEDVLLCSKFYAEMTGNCKIKIHLDIVCCVITIIHFLKHYLQALEFDREGLTKLKKAVKAIYNSGNSKFMYTKLKLKLKRMRLLSSLELFN